MTPITAEPGVTELSREEGRRLVDERSQTLLHLSLDEFRRRQADGKLDLDDPKVQRILILLPFAW
jgi:hypothetical protein